MSTSSTSWHASLVTAVLVGFGISLGARSARAQAHDTYHPAPLDTIPVEAYQGWKQFELNCSRCHGDYGVGTSFAPALIVSLKDGGTIPTKEIFIQTVCAGRPEKGMPSWCALGLEMDKIQNIYAYLKGRADGKIHAGRPAAKAEPGKSSS
jgi:mono/diheme cytochrome c family protein